MLAPPAVPNSRWTARRRPRTPLRRITLASRKQRTVRALTAAKVALLVIAAALQFAPAHEQYEGGGLQGIGSIFIGTCSGVSYSPPERAERERKVYDTHSLAADDGMVVFGGLLVLGLVLWLLARRRGFWADVAVSVTSAAGLLGLGVAIVASSLTHLFQSVESLWGEYAFGFTFVALVVVWLVHAVAVQWLYRRQRKQLERSRPVPLAWSVS